jgi:hypothetical protein
LTSPEKGIENIAKAEASRTAEWILPAHVIVSSLFHID